MLNLNFRVIELIESKKIRDGTFFWRRTAAESTEVFRPNLGKILVFTVKNRLQKNILRPNTILEIQGFFLGPDGKLASGSKGVLWSNACTRKQKAVFNLQ